ncbi:MAG: type II secretion system protein [Patescibacteria group bacterium]
MKNIFQKGFTVTEMLVVFAVVGIMAAVVIPKFSQIRESQILKDASITVVSALNKASAQTLASIDSSEYGVHFQSDRVIIFKGTSYVAGSGSNEDITLASPATITNISLTGGVSDVYFNRLTSAPNVVGTVTITVNSSTKIITIGATGIVSMN